MLFFGHLGITLASAQIVEALWQRASSRGQVGEGGKALAAPISLPREREEPRSAVRFDYRLVLLASLLPDIVDKPLALLFPSGFFPSGRTFGHTLAFLLLLALWGAYLFLRGRRTGGLALALGSLVHLLLDEMWSQPAVLFWPLLGWRFGAGLSVEEWLAVLPSFLVVPKILAGEVTGFLILAWFTLSLWRKGSLHQFLRGGHPG